MKKKILITRKLLRLNEEKAAKLWDVKLNLNDEVYSQQEGDYKHSRNRNGRQI